MLDNPRATRELQYLRNFNSLVYLFAMKIKLVLQHLQINSTILKSLCQNESAIPYISLGLFMNTAL